MTIVLQETFDPQLEAVYQFFASSPDLKRRIGGGLRQALDEVIDGPRTGRYCVEQLEKTEKTYIGTKVEIIVRNLLALPRGDVLDNKICGTEVDTKFSLSGSWMIPREAVSQICLVIGADDNRSSFDVGLLRMTPDVLTAGANQDGKRSVSALGKSRIRWLIRGAALPKNIMLQLSPLAREQILSAQSGPKRMRALFRNTIGTVIPRSVILQVGQQKDSLKRARETKAPLALEGLSVLCATYKEERAQMIEYGFDEINDDDWLCIRSDLVLI